MTDARGWVMCAAYVGVCAGVLYLIHRALSPRHESWQAAAGPLSWLGSEYEEDSDTESRFFEAEGCNCQSCLYRRERESEK